MCGGTGEVNSSVIVNPFVLPLQGGHPVALRRLRVGGRALRQGRDAAALPEQTRGHERDGGRAGRQGGRLCVHVKCGPLARMSAEVAVC